MNFVTSANKEFLNSEKIICSFIFNLSGYSNDQFEATLQVQSQRPVFDSNYDSPTLNFLDKDVVFSYQEFQPLFFNKSSFESNLVSLISFYANIIIGLDADSFELKGGDRFFEQAFQIVNLAQITSRKGWKPSDGRRNRFWLIDSLRSNSFREYRIVFYSYHREGLDQMTSNPKKGKIALMKSIQKLEKNSFIFQTRRNRKLSLTEYYDLVYEYKNDCLTAGIKYKKSYYADNDLKPTENLLFTISLFPLTSYEYSADDLIGQ